MKHWSWDSEEAKRVNNAKSRATRRVKEVFGAVLAASALNIHPLNVLELADQAAETSERGPSSRERAELAALADLGL
jgi:hypothetical protein